MIVKLLFFLMYLWALGNFTAALSVILYRTVKTPHRQKQWHNLVQGSMFLNMGAVLLISGGTLQHFYLWLLMTANLFLASWCVRIMRHRYETRLKDQKLTFRIVRVKHNTAHGTVEIDGIRYRAYIPPVWVKEHLDENGRLFPGTYKRYQAQTVQKARFKRFVPVYGNEDRPLVELG